MESFLASLGFMLLAQVTSPPERLAEVKRAISTCEGWVALPSAHYIVLTDAGADTAKRALDELEFARAVFEKEFPPKRPIEALGVVRLCKDRDEYFKNGGACGTTCAWSPMQQEMIAFVGPGDPSREWAGLRSGAFFQYESLALDSSNLHDWFSSGVASAFSASSRSADELAWQPLEDRARRLRATAGTGDWIPLAKLVEMSHADFLGGAMDQTAAEGWGLAYFLRVVTPNERWRRVLHVYWTTFRDTFAARAAAKVPEFEAVKVARDAARKAAFDGVDLAALEEAFVEFARRP
jgi:hypothetical protein